MGAVAVHPTDQILQSYGLGKLDDVSSESVSQHLEGCSDCQSRVAEMSSDSFIGRLRGAQGRPQKSATSWAQSPVSQTDHGPSVVIAPPSAETMPPGLADHPDYEVIKELGRGGMGVVYLAHNRLLGRDEVLKVMARHIMERPGLLARFLAEMRAVARLQHPNIVTAYSAFRLGESIVFAMEYVEGLDLAKLVKTKGPLPVAHASYFVSQAAQGMQHAHEQGMVHRDIKPGNLMLSHKGSRAVIKVLDFGLAKATREAPPVDGGLTNPGQALGTPDYMAPEQIRDAQKADIRADIYSLGCTLYYLLSGGPPFRAENLWDLYQAHHSMDAKLLNFVRPDVPGELAAVVAKMMAKEPERRFQTPSEVALAVAPFFKKASANVLLLNPEVSAVGQSKLRPESPATGSVPTQPATSLAPAAMPPAQKPAAPASPETRWESLIEFKKTEPQNDPVPAVIKVEKKKPRWLWPVAASGCLLMALIALLASGVLRLNSPNGTIVLENDVIGAGARDPAPLDTANGTIVLANVPADAVVEIDGEKRTLAPTIGTPVKIEARLGRHGVVVRRGEDVLLGESVNLESGKEFQLIVRHELRAESHRPRNGESDAFQAGSVWTTNGLNGEVYTFTLLERHGDEFKALYEGQQFSHMVRGTIRDSEIIWHGQDTKVLRGTQGHDNFGTIKGEEIVVTYSRKGLPGSGSYILRLENDKILPEKSLSVGSTTPSGRLKPADQAKPPAAGQDGFVQLFNGVDLTGWKTHPRQPGNWHVENGILVGSGPAAVSHLYTVRDDYKDFHLRAEARINDVGNSGVYFRAPFGPSWPANDPRFPISYEAQIYTKPGGQIYTGSLYAGPDNVVTVNVRPVLPLEWFTLEVIARGNHVVVKVNDMITADYSDMKRLYSGGHVALQQNGAETIVEFRKIEINELSPDSAALVPKTQSAGPEDVNVNASRPVAGFVPLFNGKDAAGWTAWVPGRQLSKAETAELWPVSGGVLHGIGGPSYLFSPRGDYRNFRMRAEAMINDGGNSGVFLRAPEAPRVAGYEAQINSTDRDPNKTGSLWMIGVRPLPVSVTRSPVPPDTWFKLEAEAVESRIRIWVDDRLYADWFDPQKTYTQGHITGSGTIREPTVQIRKLEVMELDQSGKPIEAGGGREGGSPRRKSSGRAKGKPSR